MKFINYDQEGLLAFAECEKPQIAADECLIEVCAIGINRADLLQKRGLYAAPEGESPILGIEVSGTIVEKGNAVSQWQPSDRVCAIVPGGGYAQFVKVKANHLISIPNHFSFEQGACIAETCLTAFQTLHWLGKIKAKQQVLIHAGASGIGISAIQIAKLAGATVTVTVGSHEKATACIELGADHAICYHDTDFVSWQKKHVPKGFDLILDCVAGDYTNKNIMVAAMDARIITIAILGGRYVEKFDMARMLQKRITLIASTLRNQNNDYKAALVNDFRATISLNDIKPILHQALPWHQSEQAHQILDNNENIGKVVMTVKA